MKPFLALFRAGPSSLHAYAVARLAEQNFDYALSWFGDQLPAEAEGAVFVHMQKGAKWPGLEHTLAAHWDTIARYEYVWMPDDDLLCVPEDVSRMFTICRELRLELAQPALTRDSYFTHVITMQHPAFQIRFTNFVEIMAPVLSASMLKRVLHTIGGSLSGFGMDTLWPRMSQVGKVAIIDDTPVKHTRPVGGPNYVFNAKAGIAPAHEALFCSATHMVDTPADFQVNFAGLTHDGNPICIGSTGEEVNAVLEAVMQSIEDLPISALRKVHYFASHFNYWIDGANGRGGYPRALLRIALNQSLKSTGIVFPTPPGFAMAKSQVMPQQATPQPTTVTVSAAALATAD